MTIEDTCAAMIIDVLTEEEQSGEKNCATLAKDVRMKLKDYFNSVGAVPLQCKKEL